MARLVGSDGYYHRSDHGSAPCGAETRRPRARETDGLLPCRACYPPSRSAIARTPATPRKRPVQSSVPDPVAAAVRRRSGGRCEAMGPDCAGTATAMHHRLRRGVGGPDTAENLAHLCDVDHAWVHEHPELSYELGLLIRSHEGPPSAAWVRPDSVDTRPREGVEWRVSTDEERTR
jgi:hypothetical protein